MITHIIYHIPGRKVGCTKNLKIRMADYLASEGLTPQHEILEELHDKTDKEAGDIEWEWADRFGYFRGVHYTVTLNTNKASTQSSNKGGFSKFSVEKRKAISRRNVELGKTGFQSPRQSEYARMGGLLTGPRSVVEGFGVHAYSPAERILIGRLGGIKSSSLQLGGMYQTTSCPYCGLEGQKAALSRWHFENCKKRTKRPMVRGN